jgi:hypothetical protein
MHPTGDHERIPAGRPRRVRVDCGPVLQGNPTIRENCLRRCSVEGIEERFDMKRIENIAFPDVRGPLTNRKIRPVRKDDFESLDGLIG